ncbi:MAG: DUF559 domain-containing protein [Patescibacteria group bacterium]
MTRLYNKKRTKGSRRYLRRQMPPAEHILWLHLRNKQLEGFKFRRQYSISKYVVDFYCPKARLAIEIDGPTHLSDQARIYDKERQQFIESFGIRFLRVNNLDVYKNMEGVIERICRLLSE